MVVQMRSSSYSCVQGPCRRAAVPFGRARAVQMRSSVGGQACDCRADAQQCRGYSGFLVA